jgi:hypothetical protein
MASRVRHDRAFWENTIRELEQSGEAHGAFAARKRVTVSGLRHWLYKLRRERKRTRGVPAPIRLVPITVTGTSPVDMLEVGVAGAVLRFPAGTDTGYVAQLVTALREAG